MSYESDNWAKLSPLFRNAYNARQRAKGLPTIPEPKVDLYVAPPPSKPRVFDTSDPEAIVAVREFMGGQLLMGGVKGEGFTIDGNPSTEAQLARAIATRRRAAPVAAQIEEGFTLNGHPIS